LSEVARKARIAAVIGRELMNNAWLVGGVMTLAFALLLYLESQR
jgi:hypothetical protein